MNASERPELVRQRIGHRLQVGAVEPLGIDHRIARLSPVGPEGDGQACLPGQTQQAPVHPVGRRQEGAHELVRPPFPPIHRSIGAPTVTQVLRPRRDDAKRAAHHRPVAQVQTAIAAPPELPPACRTSHGPAHDPWCCATDRDARPEFPG